MLIDLNKFGVAVISSTILLTGCLQNQNPDAEPPEREVPVDEPVGNGPDTDLPEADDPVIDDPDPGSEDPGSEDPGSGEPPADGANSTPYASGTQLYKIRESEAGSPNVIREERNISGSAITYDISQITSEGGSWTPYSDILPFYVAGSGGGGDLFVEMKPENYYLDTSSYTLSIGMAGSGFDIEHFFYDAAGQGIKDFVETNLALTTLGNFIAPSDQFDGSVYIYKEVLTNPEDLIVYFPGNNNGSNCRLVNDTALSATLASTGNCNVVVDGSLNLVNSTANATGTDLGSAPTLRMSALIDESIKLKSHGISETNDSGDIHLASDPDSDNNIGYYQTVSNPDGNYFEIVFNDLANQTFFHEDYLPWTGITKLIMAENDGILRIGAVIPATSELDNNTYLLNDSALMQLIDSVAW